MPALPGMTMVNLPEENPLAANEGPMGETSSPKDAFARRNAPASDRLGAGADHFKRSGGNGGGDRFARNAPAADKPTYDAFARKRAEASAPAPAPAAAPKAAKPKPPPRAAAFAAPKAEPAPKPAGLRVVPAQSQGPKVRPQVRARSMT